MGSNRGAKAGGRPDAKAKAATAPGGLEIDDDPAFQHKLWIWQRGAWAGIAAILAFGILGGFGDGPISWAEARDGSGRLRVAYERFGRMDSPSTLVLTAEPDADGRLPLRLGAGLFEDFDVGGLEAYRGDARIDADGVVYRLAGPPGAREAVVRLELRAYGPGPARIHVGLGDAPPLKLRQLVYP